MMSWVPEVIKSGGPTTPFVSHRSEKPVMPSFGTETAPSTAFFSIWIAWSFLSKIDKHMFENQSSTLSLKLMYLSSLLNVWSDIMRINSFHGPGLRWFQWPMSKCCRRQSLYLEGNGVPSKPEEAKEIWAPHSQGTRPWSASSLKNHSWAARLTSEEEKH